MGRVAITEETIDLLIENMLYLLRTWRLLGSIHLSAKNPVELGHDEDIASSLTEYRIDLGEITPEPIEDLLHTLDIIYIPHDHIEAAPQIRRSLAKLPPTEAKLTLLETLLIDAFPQRPATPNIHPINHRPDTYLLQTPRTRLIIRRKNHKNTTQLLHLTNTRPTKTPKNTTENPQNTPDPQNNPENHPLNTPLQRKPTTTTTYEIMTLWRGY